MLETIGLFLLGLVLLALGGDSIVKGAAGLAQRLGASPFVTGLLLVAFGTSLPELAVNCARCSRTAGAGAGQRGRQQHRQHRPDARRGRARRAAAGALACAVAAAAGVVAGHGGGDRARLDGVLSRLDGAVLLLAFVAVLVFALVRSASRSAGSARGDRCVRAATRTGLGLNLVASRSRSRLLYFGAQAGRGRSRRRRIGSRSGMAPLLTGLLPVAIGTALPEAAAAIVAARRGQGDLVAGHVIGSSLFNLLVVVGGMARCGHVAVARHRSCVSSCRRHWHSRCCCCRCCAATCA